MGWDVFGYYLYLPQTFIYNDPGIHDISTVQNIVDTYHNTPSLYQVYPIENGNHIIRYPMGMAMLYAPFFLIGHFFAWLFHYPTDGFSTPYQLCFLAGHLTYTIASVFLIRKILLKFFTDTVTSIALILLFFGTNFYFTFIGAAGMPHLYLFFLFAVVLLMTMKWHDKPTRLNSFLLGLVIGLATLCRPTEIVIVVIPVFYGLTKQNGLRQHFKNLFTTRLIYLVLIALGIFIICIPQFLFWKIYTGSFLYYGYNNPNEGFDFLTPHTWNFLFSPRSGWFIYTPVMLLAIPGFIQLYKSQSKWFWPALLFTLLNVYILSSWSSWHYAGSFSQRAMVQSYPLMMILLAAFIYRVIQLKNRIKWFMLTLLPFFVLLNIFQTWQLHRGIINPWRMTWKYYAAAFGKTSIPANAEKLLLVNRSLEGNDVFTDTSQYHGKWLLTEKYVNPICLNEKNPYSHAHHFPYSSITNTDHAWIKVECEIMYSAPANEVLPNLVKTFRDSKGTDFAYKGDFLGSDTTEPGTWINYSSTYLTPEMRNINDKFTTFLWVAGKGSLYIRSLKIRAYERME